MDDDRVLENELFQIEQFDELEMEDLPAVEEVDYNSSDDNSSEHGDKGDFNFNTGLASLHTYLGEVEDTQGRQAFLEGGAAVNLPMLCLEGVVLLPEATLPLRVIQRSSKAAMETAMNRVDAPYIIGVVHVQRHLGASRFHLATTGTTAEIRQFRRVEDGSLNVVTRGRQRFHLQRQWIDVEGVAWAEVKIKQEDMPLRTPKDAFLQFASVGNLVNSSYSHMVPSESSCDNQKKYEVMGNNCECMSVESIVDEDVQGRQSIARWKKPWTADESNRFCRVPRSYWPYWVYRMYDSYCLARRVADMWRQIFRVPSLDNLVKKPDLLSFYIASKIPVSKSTRQELLTIDGVSYRLRREIQLLERFDVIRCKTCLAEIAKRTDMLVMSSDGPLNAYANSHGYVHDVMTVSSANGLSLQGLPTKEHSWFPGYAWTIADCATCGSNMGWLFTATKKKLQPRSFWGIQGIKVADVS